MTYNRVLPRDLFNDANITKCIGKLVLLIEDGLIPWMSYHYDGDAFNICQNTADGSTHIANIEFFAHNETLDIRRPLNSRGNWPIYIECNDMLSIFNDDGEFVLNTDELAKSLSED